MSNVQVAVRVRPMNDRYGMIYDGLIFVLPLNIIKLPTYFSLNGALILDSFIDQPF